MNAEIDLSRAIVSTDDATIQEFLARESLLGRLEPEPPADRAALAWRSANTHTYCYCTNSRIPGDSGYVLVMLPFDEYSWQEASQIFRTIMLYDLPADAQIGTFDLTPTAN